MNRSELTITLSPSQPAPHVDARRIRNLERTIGELRARIRHLEELLQPQVSPPAAWGLVRREVQIFQALLAREPASKDYLAAVLYGDDDIETMPETILSHMSKLRAKVRPFGVEITCERNLGYRLIGRQSWRAKLGCKSAGPGISPPEPAPQ